MTVYVTDSKQLKDRVETEGKARGRKRKKQLHMKKKIYSVDNMTVTEPKWFSLDTILSRGGQGAFLQILCSGKHFHFSVFEELPCISRCLRFPNIRGHKLIWNHSDLHWICFTDQHQGWVKYPGFCPTIFHSEYCI